MTTNEFYCPHCHHAISGFPPKRKQPNNKHTMQSVASFHPPKFGPWRLLWFLRHKRDVLPVQRPEWQNTTLTVEVIDQPAQVMTITDLDERLVVGDILQVATMVMLNDYAWTRANLKRHTNLTLPKIAVLQYEFKRLEYLTVTKNNRSILSTSGKRVLRSILRMAHDLPTP